MNCIVCNKILEKEAKIIKYEKTYLCKSCFDSLLEKTDNQLKILWTAICSNTSVMMSAFLNVLVTPILISDGKVILEVSSEVISKQFELNKLLFIRALNFIYSEEENKERDIEIRINPNRKIYGNQTRTNSSEIKEMFKNNTENPIYHFLNADTFSDMWGSTVKINSFRRRDFVFAEGYYSSLKILLKIAKDEIPNIEKYLNDVDESKDILINPIMLLCHFYIELSLKRYIFKLSKQNERGHNKKKLFNILEKLWNNRTSTLKKEHWLKQSFEEGYSIANRLKMIKEIVNNLSELDPNSLTFRYCDVELNKQEVAVDIKTLEDSIDLIYDFFGDLNIAISKLTTLNQ